MTTTTTTPTEADDAALCAIWFNDESITPDDLEAVYVRFAEKYGHWPQITTTTDDYQSKERGRL